MFKTPNIVVLDSGRRSESFIVYANIHSTNANNVINATIPTMTMTDVTIQ
jgi:hypothetical protein